MIFYSYDSIFPFCALSGITIEYRISAIPDKDRKLVFILYCSSKTELLKILKSKKRLISLYIFDYTRTDFIDLILSQGIFWIRQD
jgi:hypothetical protein